MKTIRFFMSALAAVSMVAFASCQKDDSQAEDPVEDII